jgi:ferredoxin
MIITRPKPLDEILKILAPYKDLNICVVGCGICARKIKTGGEPEVKRMVSDLSDAKMKVVDGVMVKHACSAKSWDSLIEECPVLKKAEIFLVMSCGTGVSILGQLSGKSAFPALNTVSMGGAIDDDIFENMCIMCGQCNVGEFAGLCPKSGCPKSQMNGPCGGSMDGNCEVAERKCIWSRIYETLDAKGMLSVMDDIIPPVEHDRRL